MPSPFSRSQPNFRVRRNVRQQVPEAGGAVPNSAMREELPFTTSRPSRRSLPDDARALLRDASPLRPHLLFALSHGRAVEAASLERQCERARLAAFESAYLSLAALLPREFTLSEAQPSSELVAASMLRVHLIPEDRYLAAQLTSLYGVPGWETLDLDGVLEWCARVRLAVAANSNAAFEEATATSCKTLFKE